MGSSWILIEQSVLEMLVLYARGDAAEYRRLLLIQNVLFCFAFLVSGFVAPPVYEAVGHRVPFYSTAAIVLTHAVVFCAYFMRRLSRAPTGLLGGLAAAEGPAICVSSTTVVHAIPSA